MTRGRHEADDPGLQYIIYRMKMSARGATLASSPLPTLLTTNHVPALLEEGVPHLLNAAKLLLPNLLSLPRDVKEDGKGERLEVVEEAKPAPFQLQANQGRDIDAVTKSTVSVPESLILTVDKPGV